MDLTQRPNGGKRQDQPTYCTASLAKSGLDTSPARSGVLDATTTVVYTEPGGCPASVYTTVDTDRGLPGRRLPAPGPPATATGEQGLGTGSGFAEERRACVRRLNSAGAHTNLSNLLLRLDRRHSRRRVTATSSAGASSNPVPLWQRAPRCGPICEVTCHPPLLARLGYE
jgi:hypothetical protein